MAVVGGAFVGLGLWGDFGALLIAAFLVLITPLMLQGRRGSRSPTRFSAAVLEFFGERLPGHLVAAAYVAGHDDATLVEDGNGGVSKEPE